MLVYEKKVDDVRHLFGTMGNIPADEDAQLTYKDADGDVITPVAGDSYTDNSKDGVQGIVRKSDGKVVNVFIGDKCIIGKVEEKTVKSIKIKTQPTKVSYVEGEALDLAGMVVEATYMDGDKAEVTGFTTAPAAGATLATTDTKVVVTYGGKTANVAITVRAYVHATMSTNISEKTFIAGSTAPVEFTFSTVANDDAGIMVKGISDFGTKYEDKLAVLDYYTGSAWINIKGQEFGGDGFPMSDATSKFRASFKDGAAGEYNFTASMKKVDGGAILCSVDVPFTVSEA